jgi:hypothetical protein
MKASEAKAISIANLAAANYRRLIDEKIKEQALNGRFDHYWSVGSFEQHLVQDVIELLQKDGYLVTTVQHRWHVSSLFISWKS